MELDEFELREMTIDRFDVYDLVELLDLEVEDLIDKFDVLGDPVFRTKILEVLFD